MRTRLAPRARTEAPSSSEPKIPDRSSAEVRSSRSAAAQASTPLPEAACPRKPTAQPPHGSPSPGEKRSHSARSASERWRLSGARSRISTCAEDSRAPGPDSVTQEKRAPKREAATDRSICSCVIPSAPKRTARHAPAFHPATSSSIGGGIQAPSVETPPSAMGLASRSSNAANAATGASAPDGTSAPARRAVTRTLAAIIAPPR